MAVPYQFANTPVGTYLQLAQLDANFSYLTNTPTLLGLTVANTLTVNGASIFSGSALFNDISINGAITIHGQTANITGVTGTGDLVLNNSPVLVTPNLGVPSFLDLTNATNLPIASVIGIQPSLRPFLATPNSANLRAAVVDETGTGALVFADGSTLSNNNINNPTLVAPALGTPVSGDLSNCTGYPATAITGIVPVANGGTGLSALGTGVQAALGIAVNTANGFFTLDGATILPIAQGGTSAATAPLALNNLLPTQTGNTDKFLMTDGAGNPSWNFAVRPVVNIAALKAISPVLDEVITVEGYYAHGDGGGGQFYGITGAPAGTYVDNGGTVILPTGGNGSAAWVRIYDNELSVKWFGAKGDGISDDLAAITAAIAATPTYGVLNFNYGTYVVSNTITLARDNITLCGPATILAKAASNFEYVIYSPFVTSAPPVGHTGIVIKDLIVDANQTNRAATQTIRFCGIGFVYASQCSITGCTIQNSYGLPPTPAVGIGLSTCSYFKVDNCYFKNCGTFVNTSDGIYSSGNRIQITNCLAEGCTDTAYVLERTNNSIIGNCVANGCGSGGAITAYGAGTFASNIINGLTIYDWHGGNTGGLLVGVQTTTATATLTSTVVSNVTMYVATSGYGTGPAFNIASSAGGGRCKNLIVSNLSIDRDLTVPNVSTQGILVDADSVTISNCAVRNTLASCIQIQSGTGHRVNSSYTSPFGAGASAFGIITNNASSAILQSNILVGGTWGAYAFGTSTITASMNICQTNATGTMGNVAGATLYGINQTNDALDVNNLAAPVAGAAAVANTGGSIVKRMPINNILGAGQGYIYVYNQ